MGAYFVWIFIGVGAYFVGAYIDQEPFSFVVGCVQIFKKLIFQ